MLSSDIEYLQCVDCQGGVSIEEAQTEEDVVKHGLLKCVNCSRYYAIINYVGIFFRKHLMATFLKPFEIKALNDLGYQKAIYGVENNADVQSDLVLEGSKNWEYQWSKEFLPMDEDLLEQDTYYGLEMFQKFIPIDFSDLKDKIVLIAGSGRGREVYHVSKFNPRKIVVAELGASIYSTFNCFICPGKHMILLRCDMTYHPIKPKLVDVSICDHALQHVLEHSKAFSKLVEATKIQGTVAICVYDYENNFVMTKIIEPSKIILHLFSFRVQKFLAIFPALALYSLINGLYVPINKISKTLADKFPLNEQFVYWAANSFKILWTTCFDLIHAPISYHFKKSEVENLSKANNLSIKKLINTQGTTWSLIAEKNSD